MLGGTRKIFIWREDNILMPAGGTGFIWCANLCEPVLFFWGNLRSSTLPDSNRDYKPFITEYLSHPAVR